MTATERSLVVGGIILTGSTTMTFYGAFLKVPREPLWSTCMNASLLIFVWSFYVWAWRYHQKRKSNLTDAQKLARGLDMTDIKNELSKPCPSHPKNSSTNR